MRPPVALLGPTASGKSDVAMAAAGAVPGTEIVAVDAMQVYRGMDIGTAKPTVADRAAVVHHCLDLADPNDEMSVTEFRRAYDEALLAIASRAGCRALLVAGTGLYLTAAVDRLELPGVWPDVRATIEAEPDTAVLYTRLKTSTPRPPPRSTLPTAGESCGRWRCRWAAVNRSARSARVSGRIRRRTSPSTEFAGLVRRSPNESSDVSRR